ncbi:heme exporter protein CcmD [Oceanicaulis sp. MMSF_3324]|uniref:heme exporter protein CcmD n=1 Tax=Oceanicaulis sp. MMSF_3324 TaxID=3046702 RepID=UPI00273F1BBD|nr:heme exporter protein CcmD [Oceanicaulis sp. MMSF_3324]
MSALADFLSMDGYAVYVWVSYGLSLLGSAGLVILAVNRRRAASARLARLEAQEAALKPGAVLNADEDAA